MNITLTGLSAEQARRVIDFVDGGGAPLAVTNFTYDPGTETPPLSPVAASSVSESNARQMGLSDVYNADSLEEVRVPITSPTGPISIETVKEAVVEAVNRIDAAQPEGNPNAAAYVVNLLDSVCGCKKVKDIAPEHYEIVVQELNKLGV